MKIQSFRVRIAMLSVLCSSLVLVGSALAAWQIVWRSELRRADRFITTIVHDNVSRGFHPPPGSRPSLMPFGLMGDRGDPRRFDRRSGRGNRPDWTREPDNPDGPDAPRGSEGRMPWRRPAWQRPPEIHGDGRDTSEPTSLFQYHDLVDKFESHSENWSTTQTIKGLVIPMDGSVQLGTHAYQGKLWRIGAGGNAERSMVFGFDLEPAVTIIGQLASAFLFSIPVALVFIALGAVFMARRALRPVHDLTALVERITAHGLGERVESRVKDAEFEKLIQVFNQMMDRLERSFMQANRFSADAAHELRTPITVLQGHVERMLHDAEPGSAMQQGLGDMVDELHRIKSILEKLLLLARMDAGEFRVRLTPQNLSEMVESIVEDIQAVAPGIAVESRIEPGIRVAGDAPMLETAIQNIGGNAVKYNVEEGGWIGIELRRQKETVLLAISNTGPKIALDDREKIFDRFYRADKARSRETDGLGLGLSLAREIVQAHHGTMRLVEEGEAINRFEIELPLSTGE